MNKPELVVNVGSLEDIKRLVRAGANAVIVGEHKFGVRLPNDMQIHQIQDAVAWCHRHGTKVYVAVNQIFDHDTIPDLEAYLHELQLADVDALLYTDPAVVMINRQLVRPLALHWSGDMTSTNYGSANFWAKQGASRVVLARELNLEEIKECKRNVQIDIQIQVHGITNIYHSKRHLVQSYYQYMQNKQQQSHNLPTSSKIEMPRDAELYLIERERPDQCYPIYEDRSGTHIMSSEDICMLENMDDILALQCESLKIEGFMKSLTYNETVVRSYRAAIDAYVSNPEQYVCDPKWLTAIAALQDPKRELNFGFYYKEQVY